MAAPTARNLKTFVGAKDFDQSLAFYLALGFTMRFQEETIAGLDYGTCSFFLQRYYDKDWCDNMMLHMEVDDARAWQTHVGTVIKAGQYGGARVAAPKPTDYAKLVTHFWDPSGVLWHLAQLT